MPDNIRFVSIAENVFEKIEDRILSGEYPKGSVFTESRLSEDFGVSRTPIREAIRRLEQENLIRITTKGIEITGVEKSDLADIYEIRTRIEGFAAGKCAVCITDEQLAGLREIVDLQEYYAEKSLADKVRDTDSAFHESIYECCGSSIYRTVLVSLHRRIRKYRRISVQNPERAAKMVLEHRQIYDAIAAHNAALAEELTSKHIRNAYENIQTMIL